MKLEQTLVGAGVLVLGLLIAAGATQISSEAGYGGVGPNFLPWVVGGLLALCGAVLVWEALTGGFRELEAASGADSGHWAGFVWVSIGLLANAALITRIGFILSCTLCFVLAVRGFRSSEGRLDLSLRALIVDALIGMAIAAPVFWMFTKFLAISLPGLTDTGWI
jgi:putative tricarboxylic transport membrane protein